MPGITSKFLSVKFRKISGLNVACLIIPRPADFWRPLLLNFVNIL